MKRLTPKQKAFVAEFMVDLNGAAAARRAGYSKRAADRQAWENLRKPEIQTAIRKALQERAERTLISCDQVIRELAAVAYLDPGEISPHRLTGPEDLKTLPEHVRRAIVGWSWTRDGRFVPKLASKLDALEKLARHLGLYQAPRENDADREADLLATVLWRYVMALHLQRGVSIAEAVRQAELYPEEVEKWGEEVGLLGPGSE